MILAFQLEPGIVAIATALFFGMCAAAFLPVFVAALFWKRANRAGAIAGMLAGFASWALWVLLVHEKEAAALGAGEAPLRQAQPALGHHLGGGRSHRGGAADLGAGDRGGDAGHPAPARLTQGACRAGAHAVAGVLTLRESEISLSCDRGT